MSEKHKTISFVIVAIGLTLVSLLVHFMTQPRSISELESIGEPFYKDFNDPAKAQTLEVTALNELGSVKSFVIKKINDQWRIPSHHNYPAEATSRLARTATSLIGLKRESVAGRKAIEHERYGVLDPNDKENTNVEASGKRITMKDGEGNILVDLIIGNKVERQTETDGFGPKTSDPEFENYYYVRRPDETPTFQAQLDLDLSTSFSDWIEPDLLKIGDNRVTQIHLNKNRLVEKSYETPLGIAIQNELVPGEQLALKRTDEASDWQLDGLNEEAEELDTFKVSDMAAHLTDIEIKGVRPKFSFGGEQILTADLNINISPELRQNPQQAQAVIEQLQSEMLEKGFELARDPNSGELYMVSSRGDLAVSTDSGVKYWLNFGEVIVGDETEIEIGGSTQNESKEKDGSESQQPNGDETGDNEAENNETKNGETSETNEEESEESQENNASRNRYLMVRVEFDETLVKQPLAPIKPIEPVKPEGYDEWQNERIKKEIETGEPADSAEDQQNNGSEESDAPELPDEVSEEVNAQEEEFLLYQVARQKYLTEMETFPEKEQIYEEETRAYRRKIRQGKRLVRELNERFGEWYYVIADSSFEKLQTSRDELVSAKQIPPENPLAPPQQKSPTSERPDIDFSIDGENSDQESK